MSKNNRQQHVPLSSLAWLMFYIGIAGYGGGPAIIAYLHDVFVNRKGLMTEDDFLTGVSLSQMLPGANAMATVVYIGYRLNGSWGAIVAPAAFIAPSTALMTALSALYFTYGSLHITQVLFIGLGAVVIGLLINALLVMGRPAIKDIWSALIALAVLLGVYFLNMPIPLAVAVSAAAGLLIYWRPRESTEAPATKVTPTPRGFWRGSLLALIAGAILLALTAQTPVTRLFLPLLRAGALTFGGGFASIPLFQHEVTLHHWLDARQFLDGIALGQVTPGPVLITSTFIGYKVLGILGAVLATVAVFLPGAVAMFFVAHISERFMRLRGLQAIVRGIVAGFIGVILAVVIRLAQVSITDWKTASLAAASAIVLIVLKKDPIWVIIGGAVLSLVLFW